MVHHIQVGTDKLVDGYAFKLINLFLEKSELTYVKKISSKCNKNI